MTKNSSGIRDCMQGYIDDQTVVYIPIWKQTNGRPADQPPVRDHRPRGVRPDDYPNHAVDVTGHFVEFYSYPSVPAGFGAPPCSATTDPNCDERFNFIGLVQ